MTMKERPRKDDKEISRNDRLKGLAHCNGREESPRKNKNQECLATTG